MVTGNASSAAARTLHPGLELRVPGLHEDAEFQCAQAASESTPGFLQFHVQGATLADYLCVLEDARQGRALPAGFVPTTFLLAFDQARIVGRISIRHRLNAFLEREGGHIGYAVLPAFRGRGYASAILRDGLLLARRELGLSRLLLTCDTDNPASARVIECNGGVLQDVVPSTRVGIGKRRYWISAPLR